jgi:hypothetical protein
MLDTAGNESGPMLFRRSGTMRAADFAHHRLASPAPGRPSEPRIVAVPREALTGMEPSLAASAVALCLSALLLAQSLL